MNLLWKSLICIVALIVALGRSFVAAAAELPNVLMILADDHASYVCGAYGNNKVKTPNLDQFAQSGVVFTNAFVNCPLCTASRQSLLTGRMPHDIQVTQLRTALGDDPVTLAELLKEKGYATAAIGKMHFNSARRHGFDLLLDTKDHREFLNQNPPRPLPEGLEVLPPWRPFNDPASIWLNGSYLPYGAYDEDMAGTWFARNAQRFMQEHLDKPFFLMVSFYEPHSPFHFPIEYRDRHDPSTFDVPEVLPQDAWQIPEIFRDLTKEQKQGIIASYYTSTEFMDSNVGRVLQTLQDTGLEKETLVIYLGDHGYSLGHHGRFEKHTHFEESVRAPLIIRLPNGTRASEEEAALVEFIDLFPTVAEFCETEPPDEVTGQSLLPLLRGEVHDGREFVFSEYYESEEAMVRDPRYKLIYTTGKREREDGYQTGLPLPGRTRMLYDLQSDPQELQNLADDPQQQERIASMEQRMIERLAESHPEEASAPKNDSRENLLDFYLTLRKEN